MTEPSGILIFTAFNKPEKINSCLIDSLIDLYMCSPFVLVISEDNLSEDMVKAGLESINTVDFNGIILEVGTIPE